MYDLLDRPTCELPAFERDLLDATRRWVHALTTAGRAPDADRRESAFDRVMGTLDAGSTEELVIQRPCHATVEETEAVILGLWRLVRAARQGDARATAALLGGGGHADGLVDAMAEACAAG